MLGFLLHNCYFLFFGGVILLQHQNSGDPVTTCDEQIKDTFNSTSHIHNNSGFRLKPWQSGSKYTQLTVFQISWVQCDFFARLIKPPA